MNSKNQTQTGADDSDDKLTKFSNPRNSVNQNPANLRISPSPRGSIFPEDEEIAIDERWCQLKITGKNLSGRSYHSMALFQDCLYIYGGYQVDVGVLGDFYCLPILGVQSYKWYRVPVSYQDSTDELVNSPGARMRHSSIVYKDKMYVFGGKKNSKENNSELFSFEFAQNAWKKLENKGSKLFPTDSHNAALSDASGEAEMIIFGGFSGGSKSDFSNSVFAYNFVTSEWRTLYQQAQHKNTDVAPLPRAGSAIAIYQSQMFIFGGGTFHSKFDDFWVFDLLACRWVQIDTKTKEIPDQRNGHSMVIYQNNFLFIFGGIMDITKEKNDVYAYDISKNIWKRVHTQTNSSSSKSPGLKNRRDQGLGIDDQNERRKRNTKTISPIKMAARQSLSTNEQSYPNKRSPMKGNYNGDTKQLSGSGSVDKTVLFTQTGTNHNTSHLLHRSGKSKINIYNDPYIQLDSGTGNLERNSDSYNPTKQIIENKKRAFLQKKHQLLDELDEKDAKEKEKLRGSSPVTEAMMNSLNQIGNQQNQDRQNFRGVKTSLKTENYNSPSPLQKSKGENVFFENNQKSRLETLGAYFDSTHNLLIGKKPCARDGQAVCLVENRMVIYGGDRHLMSLNDLYFFDLDLTISKHLSN